MSRKSFILKFVLCVLILVFLLPYMVSYAEDSLELLIKEGLKNNLQIQVLYNKWQAELYKANYSGSLPDPVASFGYFGESVQTRVGPQEYKYGISQKVPFPGKLSFLKRVQVRKSDIQREEYEAFNHEVIKGIKFIFYDIFWVDMAIRVTNEEKSILENLEKVAQRKYESNLTSQQDVIKIQVELSKLIDKLYMLEQNKKTLHAKMNGFLNRSEGEDFGPIADLSSDGFAYDLKQLFDIAKSSKQELKQTDLEIEKAEYEKSLAKMGFVPDFRFGVEYIQIGRGDTISSNDGQDAWMGMVSVNVPIWFGKIEAQIKEKEALLAAAKKEHEDVLTNLHYEVEDLFYKIKTYKSIISLYETALLPQTEQSFNVTRTGYEADKVSFFDLLDSERILLQTRLAYYKAIVDYQKTIAFLERVIGREL